MENGLVLLGVSNGIREGNERGRYKSSTVGICVVTVFYTDYDGGYTNYACVEIAQISIQMNTHTCTQEY